jgi:hypothetical protein
MALTLSYWFEWSQLRNHKYNTESIQNLTGVRYDRYLSISGESGLPWSRSNIPNITGSVFVVFILVEWENRTMGYHTQSHIHIQSGTPSHIHTHADTHAHETDRNNNG